MPYGRPRSALGPALLAGLLLFPPLAGPAASHPARLAVTITAYTWTGHRTAAGVVPRRGMLAVSRDVERDLGLRFGEPLEVSGVGRLVVTDRMPRRWHRRVDVYLPTHHAAVQFGRRTGWLTRCP
jgi:3D (Asp-Asp-Asp) domain-containing protein